MLHRRKPSVNVGSCVLSDACGSVQVTSIHMRPHGAQHHVQRGDAFGRSSVCLFPGRCMTWLRLGNALGPGHTNTVLKVFYRIPRHVPEVAGRLGLLGIG